MGKRFNVYLNEDTEEMFNKTIERMNLERIKKNKFKSFNKEKEVTNSELIQYLIKKYYIEEREECLEKLNYHTKMVAHYESKMKVLNFDEGTKTKLINEVI